MKSLKFRRTSNNLIDKKPIQSLYYSTAAFFDRDSLGQYTSEYTLTKNQLCSNKLRHSNDRDHFKCVEIDEMTFRKFELKVQTINFKQLEIDQCIEFSIKDGPCEVFKIIYQDGSNVELTGYCMTLLETKDSENASSLVNELFALIDNEGE